MVIRKPGPPTALPYPATPTSPRQSLAELPTAAPPPESPYRPSQSTHIKSGSQQSISGASGTSDDWTEVDPKAAENGPEGLFDSRDETDKRLPTHELPSSLRVGPPDGTPRTSFESQRSQELEYGTKHRQGNIQNNETGHQRNLSSPESRNPFLRTRSKEQTSLGVTDSNEESSADIWADVGSFRPPSRGAPPPPKQSDQGNSLVPQMSNLSLLEGSYAAPATSEPWMQPSSSAKGKASLIDPENSYYNLEAGTLLQPDQDTTFRDQYSNVADSARWPEAYRQECSGSSQPTQDLLGEQLPQELDSHSLQTSQYPLQPGFPISGLETSGQEDGKIPSRTSQELDQGPPPTPPRPQVTTSRESLGRAPTSDAETPQSTAIRQQRSETYQIKQITWFDASSPTNPRKSPIMVQNANGPCPLLALVNALTLSTPSNITTALVDTLRVREQVSLGLLLDAVFDELMSGRRGDAAHELPDVSDLYSFLVTLHTGMNVNPRFVPPERIPNIMDASMLDLPATVHESRRPGGFEETNEMRLYSTFSVPLIHGWLPPRTHPTFAAVERAAKTYEDAQNLMFRDEELEDKLQHQGLNQDEQLLLEDIASVKYFLTSSATQLTRYGLDTITEALQPGSVAILFRNDHFSTLYKHPESGQLLALVTDMGYAGHDEVVWESLVDVSGEGSEFFAGDFRPVGNTINEAQQKGSNKATQDDQGWTTVPESSSNKKARKSSSNNAGPSQDVLTSTNPQSLPTPPLEETYNLPTSPTTEQEDHDLALAMQLQEEEEDRSRQEVAAREREDALSRAYLESQTNSANPGRRRNGGRRQQQEVRPMVPPRGGAPVRRDPEAGEDMPPPSYEQAAKGPAYHPPSGAPDYPNGGVAAGPGNSGDRPPLNRSRQQSAYSQQAGNFGGPPAAGRRSQARQSFSNRAGGSDGAPGVMRRRSNGMGGFDGEDDGKKDCIVM